MKAIFYFVLFPLGVLGQHTTLDITSMECAGWLHPIYYHVNLVNNSNDTFLINIENDKTVGLQILRKDEWITLNYSSLENNKLFQTIFHTECGKKIKRRLLRPNSIIKYKREFHQNLGFEKFIRKSNRLIHGQSIKLRAFIEVVDSFIYSEPILLNIPNYSQNDELAAQWIFKNSEATGFILGLEDYLEKRLADLDYIVENFSNSTFAAHATLLKAKRVVDKYYANWPYKVDLITNEEKEYIQHQLRPLLNGVNPQIQNQAIEYYEQSIGLQYPWFATGEIPDEASYAQYLKELEDFRKSLKQN